MVRISLDSSSGPAELLDASTASAEDVVVQKRLEYRQLLDEQNAKMVPQLSWSCKMAMADIAIENGHL